MRYGITLILALQFEAFGDRKPPAIVINHSIRFAKTGWLTNKDQDRDKKRSTQESRESRVKFTTPWTDLVTTGAFKNNYHERGDLWTISYMGELTILYMLTVILSNQRLTGEQRSLLVLHLLHNL